MDANFAEYRRQFDTDPLPLTPVIVFSSNMPIPEADLPGIIIGEGSWNGERETSYALDAEDAWRIWPYVGDQTALLYLGRRDVGSATRVAYLLTRGVPGKQRLGLWHEKYDYSEGDYSLFKGVRYGIDPE